MSRNLIKATIIGLIFVVFLLILSIPTSFSQSSQTIGNIVLAPTGTFVIPTTSSSATFTAYVINNNPATETVTVYLNGNAYSTLSIPPYSYTPVSLSLQLGKNIIIVDGQTLTVIVNKVNSSVSGKILLNGSIGSIYIKGAPGKSYTVNLSVININNWNASAESYISSSIFYTNMYRIYNFPVNLQTPIQNSTFLLFQVPLYIPQGLYYFFNYLLFYNTSNYQQVLGYIPYFVFINVSYGLNGSLVTSNTYTLNNITVSFATVGNYTYILSKYPFNLNDKVIVEVLPQSPSLKPFTTILENYSITISAFSQTFNEIYYGSNNASFAYGNSWIEVKIPVQYTGTQYQLNITYVTPTGIISTGLTPTVTSTTTTSTTSSTTTSSSTTSTTTSTTSSTTSTSTTTTTTSTTTTSTTTTSTTSTTSSTTTSSSTTSTTTSTTSSTTSTSTTTTTTPSISTPLIIGIVIIILVIVIVAVVLLRRR